MSSVGITLQAGVVEHGAIRIVGRVPGKAHEFLVVGIVAPVEGLWQVAGEQAIKSRPRGT